MNTYPAAPVDPTTLTEKVERLKNSVGELIEGAGAQLPKSANDPFEFFYNRYEAFNDAVVKNDMDAAAEAARYMSQGASNGRVALANSPSFAGKISDKLHKATQEALTDLKAYCESHVPAYNVSDLVSTGQLGKPTVSVQGGDHEKRFAELSAKAEEMQRSFVAMEARLKAIGDTADKAVARVEDLTVQQADAMRTALTREVANISEQFISTNQELKNRLSEFDDFRNQATDLLAEMSGGALSGVHGKRAKKEEDLANGFRIAALGLMLSSVGWLFYALLQAGNNEISWTQMLFRGALSFLLVVPTAYLARESAKHRALAVELQRASLDFAALEPFLKNMSADEGLKLRAELARRAFFTDKAIDNSSSYGLDPQAIVMKAMEVAGDAVKKK